jgi:hypothetical protein
LFFFIVLLSCGLQTFDKKMLDILLAFISWIWRIWGWSLIGWFVIRLRLALFWLWSSQKL